MYDSGTHTHTYLCVILENAAEIRFQSEWVAPLWRVCTFKPLYVVGSHSLLNSLVTRTLNAAAAAVVVVAVAVIVNVHDDATKVEARLFTSHRINGRKGTTNYATKSAFLLIAFDVLNAHHFYRIIMYICTVSVSGTVQHSSQSALYRMWNAQTFWIDKNCINQSLNQSTNNISMPSAAQRHTKTVIHFHYSMAATAAPMKWFNETPIFFFVSSIEMRVEMQLNSRSRHKSSGQQHSRNTWLPR